MLKQSWEVSAASDSVISGEMNSRGVHELVSDLAKNATPAERKTEEKSTWISFSEHLEVLGSVSKNAAARGGSGGLTKTPDPELRHKCFFLHLPRPPTSPRTRQTLSQAILRSSQAFHLFGRPGASGHKRSRAGLPRPRRGSPHRSPVPDASEMSDL